MPYSMPIAEPVGIIAGMVVGRIGSRLGADASKTLTSAIMKQLGWDVPAFIDVAGVMGAFAGGFAGHYLASVVTKGIINVISGDVVVGLPANVAVTSPVFSLGDGIFSAITEAFPGVVDAIPDLSDVINDSLSSPETHSALTQLFPDADLYSRGANAFCDDPYHIASPGHSWSWPMLDIQEGNSCGAKQIEAWHEIYHGDYSGGHNKLDRVIQSVAKKRDSGIIQRLREFFDPDANWGTPNSDGTFSINPDRYPELLREVSGIESSWHDFDQQTILGALKENRPVMVQLDSSAYETDAGGFHVITLTGYGPDAYGQPSYHGIDSNYDHPRAWRPDQIQDAITRASEKYNSGEPLQVLIANQPMPIRGGLRAKWT